MVAFASALEAKAFSFGILFVWNPIVWNLGVAGFPRRPVPLVNINRIAYTQSVQCSPKFRPGLVREERELKRWLAKQGATFTPAKGSHFHVYLNGKQSIIPMHQSLLQNSPFEPSGMAVAAI
jgi:mRNA interferase HicA